MKHALIAATLALSTLSGCASILTANNCQRALTGLTAASDIAQVLIRFGYAPEAAAKAAEAIASVQLAVATACAQAAPPPVAVPQP